MQDLAVAAGICNQARNQMLVFSFARTNQPAAAMLMGSDQFQSESARLSRTSRTIW